MGKKGGGEAITQCWRDAALFFWGGGTCKDYPQSQPTHPTIYQKSTSLIWWSTTRPSIHSRWDANALDLQQLYKHLNESILAKSNSIKDISVETLEMLSQEKNNSDSQSGLVTQDEKRIYYKVPSPSWFWWLKYEKIENLIYVTIISTKGGVKEHDDFLKQYINWSLISCAKWEIHTAIHIKEMIYNTPRWWRCTHLQCLHYWPSRHPGSMENHEKFN